MKLSHKLFTSSSFRFGWISLLIFFLSIRWVDSSSTLVVITDIAIGISLAAITVRSVRFSNRMQIDVVSILILSLILYRLAISPFSPLPQVSVQVALDGLLLFLVFFLIQADFSREVDNYHDWLFAIIASSLVFALIDLLSAYHWYRNWFLSINNFSNFPPIGFRSSGSLLMHPNLLAGYINISFPFLFLAAVSPQKRLHRILAVVSMGILVISEYFTSSRGGWLSAIAGISLATVLYFKLYLEATTKLKEIFHGIKSNLKTSTLIGLALLVGFISIFAVFYNQASQTRHAPLFQSRQDVWKNAIEIFKLAPFWGNGPGSIRPLYADIAQIPPGFSAGHAHNLFLQLGGETGIIGFMLSSIALAYIVAATLRVWRKVPRDERIWLAGSTGALASLFLHNQFDYLFEALPNVLGLVVVIGIILKFSSSSIPSFKIPKSTFNLVALAVLLGILIFHVGQLKPSNIFFRAVSSVQKGNWAEAQTEICGLADEYPYNSHFGFQCGYATAENLYQTDKSIDITRVIKQIEYALHRDPYWPMHTALHANLLWVSGEQDRAIAEMESALQSTPQNSFLALNLGSMNEARGNTDEAINFYRLALELDPFLSKAIFFDGTTLRKTIRDQFSPRLQRGEGFTEVWQGWLDMEQGTFASAEEHFREALNLLPFDPYAFSGLAFTLAEQGRLEEARYYFESAKLLENHRSLTLHKLAQTAKLLELEADAQGLLDQTYRSSRWRTDSRKYLTSTYRAPALPSDRSPFMQHADFSNEIAIDLLIYAERLKDEGETKVAGEIVQWIESEIGHPISTDE